MFGISLLGVLLVEKIMPVEIVKLHVAKAIRWKFNFDSFDNFAITALL